ncbi:hypothetical protein E2562_007524 [Oryza meyeriana var. granulata]|uniref:Late embryogenesis abundant protein LEA-2 subgroup domain-containing protein n=1 Tax=Oryza meyeriana var. granulata TaxID=110450 RepID=A0A6G1DV83_9ORYZ|nr:hypothetical protein E2562_007524 [Oryza meyeriana var. granulata]
MSSQPATPQAGDGDPMNLPRTSGAAPSASGEASPQPLSPPARHRSDESFHGVWHAVTPRDDGAGTSAAVAGARPGQRVRFVTYDTEARHGGSEAPARSPGKPHYVPVKQRRAEEGQPHAAPPRPAAGHRQPPPVPAPHAAVPQEPLASTPLVPRGAKPPKTFTTQRTIERTSTLVDEDGGGGARALPDEQASGGSWPAPQPPPRGPRYVPPSPHYPKKNKRKSMSLCCCCTVCCTLFWLLAFAVGLVAVVFLVHHPKPPRLRVISATLNAGRIDKLGGDARALNANLTVLAAISNPNTKISIVLRYVQLDLYFEGSMIGTAAVWPAPVQEEPRGSEFRSVHLVVSNVTMTQNDVYVWQNDTAKGGRPVVLELAGRLHTQLNFGRWLSCRYWAKPHCTLWLDPPPSGALRLSQC